MVKISRSKINIKYPSSESNEAKPLNWLTHQAIEDSKMPLHKNV